MCWTTIAGLGAIHLGGIAGVVWLVTHHSLPTVAAAAITYVLSGLAITAGYHRLFSHRSYRAAAPVRWFFLVSGAASFQNSAVSWSADHRAHHAHTDTALDPYTVTAGVWHAHVGWLFRRRVASADVTRLTDLWNVRSVRLQHKHYAPIAITSGLIVPALVAAAWHDAMGGLLVAGFLRATVLLQATFCINSLAHLRGRRTYDANSTARDSTLTALLTFGEGYHSYHHRFPFDFRNGIHWWQFDPSKWLIFVLNKVGLTSRLHRASASSIASAAAPSTTGVSP